jgi:MFS family permease
VQEHDTNRPSTRYAWYVVGILTLAYTVSFIDRQIMALMIEPIRADLRISDTQVSLLIGLAFAAFYTVMGIPIARLADRHSRRAIVAVGVTVWCCMTASCGLARNYTQIFLARVGVGVGEAALSPSALSMISDLFPRGTRGRAIAVYNMGISLGAGLAMILGGLLLTVVLESEPLHLPIVGQLHSWQTVFLLVGLPGLAIAALMTTISEPSRRERLRDGDRDLQLPLADTLRFFRLRARLYASHFFGLAMVATLAYGLLAWVPTMFIRTWGWSIGQIGVAYGIITLLAGPIAVLQASWLSERFDARGCKDGHIRAAAYSAGMAALGAVGAALAPSPELAVIMLVPASVGTTAATASGLAGLVTVTPNQMRAQASALYYFVVNLVSLTIGPTGIALLTDFVFRDPSALRFSVACIASVVGIIAAVALSSCLEPYRMACAEARSWSDPLGQVAT